MVQGPVKPPAVEPPPEDVPEAVGGGAAAAVEAAAGVEAAGAEAAADEIACVGVEIGVATMLLELTAVVGALPLPLPEPEAPEPEPADGAAPAAELLAEPEPDPEAPLGLEEPAAEVGLAPPEPAALLAGAEPELPPEPPVSDAPLGTHPVPDIGAKLAAGFGFCTFDPGLGNCGSVLGVVLQLLMLCRLATKSCGKLAPSRAARSMSVIF